MNKETKQAEKVAVDSHPIFAKENFNLMIAGLVIAAIGFLLMVGGASHDPNQFNVDDVYSFRRITLAPIVIILGLLVEVYAIMRKPKH
jgi:hypothetical protein